MSYPVFSDPPIATQLKTLWPKVDSGQLSQAAFSEKQNALLGAYREIWADAQVLPNEQDLSRSLCLELGRLVGCDDLQEIQNRCRLAVHAMKSDWESTVVPAQAETIQTYYDTSEHYAYELIWWHALEEDLSPLAYVSALHLALNNGCKEALDFGSGVGSGSLLFARHGANISLADISSTLLDFCKHRLAARNVPAKFLDLKTQALPIASYDFITAMDVFEHIAEPEDLVDTLDAALKPGGILFGRFASEIDPDRPSHIANNFEPMFARLSERGYTEIWRDEWLWGHQAFQKTRG